MPRQRFFIQHLDSWLRAGQTVEVPTILSHSCTTQETRSLPPAPVVIVEGILVFVDEAIRDRLDAKAFVDTDADTCVIRVFDATWRLGAERFNKFENNTSDCPAPCTFSL